MNVSGIKFSPYSYNKALAFKATPEEVADKFKQVDLQEPDDIVDFDIATRKEKPETFTKAAELLKESHPYHSKYLLVCAERISK